MTDEMIDFIKDPACVLKWAGFSLAERAALLHRRFPHVRVSGSTIGRYYRKLRIKMKAVAIKKLVDRKEKLRVRRETPVARENLRMHLFSGAKIYFLDEAMFTSKTYRKREFMTSR